MTAPRLVALLGLMLLYPTVQTINYSFANRDATEYVGLDNYRDVLGSDAFQSAIDALDGALAHHADGGPLEHAKFARDKVASAMVELRKHADALETMVADDLWPLPTYREMLFLK